MGDNDCIKCATCVVACPKKAINFEKELKKAALTRVDLATLL